MALITPAVVNQVTYSLHHIKEGEAVGKGSNVASAAADLSDLLRNRPFPLGEAPHPRRAGHIRNHPRAARPCSI